MRKDICDGLSKKCGVNEKPKTKLPSPPKPQCSSLVGRVTPLWAGMKLVIHFPSKYQK